MTEHHALLTDKYTVQVSFPTTFILSLGVQQVDVRDLRVFDSYHFQTLIWTFSVITHYVLCVLVYE